MMKGTIRHATGAAALLALLLSLCVSCSDDGISTASLTGGDGSSVTVGLTLRAAAGYTGNGFESGTGYENYINVADGDYRIYFFTNTASDGNDTFIAKFNPTGVVPVEGTDYTAYNVQGEVPSELLQYTTFKIVMLANWGNYEDNDFDSSTTIKDICTAEWAVYDHLTDFELSPSNLIPFYGVNTYKDVEFKKGEFTKLDGELTLLRAMAKVEVMIDDSENAEGLIALFTDARIYHYNDNGFCAPIAYEETDYYNGYNYTTDFLDDVHLVGGYNDYDTTVGTPIERSLKFQPNDDGTMWYAYVPEYDNTTDVDDYAYIEVMLQYQGNVDGPYTIYFANYTTNGTTDNSTNTRYDIQRNNLYRFTVSLETGYFRVMPQHWEATFENDFTVSDEDTSDDDGSVDDTD